MDAYARVRVSLRVCVSVAKLDREGACFRSASGEAEKREEREEREKRERKERICTRLRVYL
jgi:hypothetical protein